MLLIFLPRFRLNLHFDSFTDLCDYLKIEYSKIPLTRKNLPILSKKIGMNIVITLVITSNFQEKDKNILGYLK